MYTSLSLSLYIYIYIYMYVYIYIYIYIYIIYVHASRCVMPNLETWARTLGGVNLQEGMLKWC